MVERRAGQPACDVPAALSWFGWRGAGLCWGGGSLETSHGECGGELGLLRQCGAGGTQPWWDPALVGLPGGCCHLPPGTLSGVPPSLSSDIRHAQLRGAGTRCPSGSPPRCLGCLPFPGAALVHPRDAGEALGSLGEEGTSLGFSVVYFFYRK